MEASVTAGPKYRVKLPFGIGHLSPSAILHAIPSKEAPFIRRDGVMIRDENSSDVEGCGITLDSKYQLLFGTETIYIFMRMYTLVCSVLSDTREHCLAFPPTADPADSYLLPSRTSEAKKPAPKLDFSSVLSALEKVLAGKITARDFETLGRKVTREKVHQITALPKLVDRCADAMLKMAEEDTVLNLYDFCQYNSVDPVALRTQCLAVVPDASYRIQFDPSAGAMTYCFIEIGSSLATAPAHGEADDANEMMEDDTNIDTADDDIMEEEDATMEDARNPYNGSGDGTTMNGDKLDGHALPDAKRARLE